MAVEWRQWREDVARFKESFAGPVAVTTGAIYGIFLIVY